MLLNKKMMRKRTTGTSNQDFSQGSVLDALVRMAVPMSLALLINILYSVVDRIYIGHIPEVGRLSLTGIGLISPIVTIIVAFQNLFGVGGSPLFSIARGEGNKEEASRILHNACFMLLINSILLTMVVLLTSKKLLYLIGASDATFPYASSYLKIYILGTVFVLFSLGLNPYINAQGDAKVGMLTVLIGAVVNLILDPIFIFGLHMGVRGAAIATVVAQFCSAMWVFLYFRSNRSPCQLSLRMLKPDIRIISRIASLGVTEFVFQLTNSIVLLLYNVKLLALGGDIYVTAMTVIYSIREITNVIMFGIVGASKPIIGFNYGARCYDRVKQGITYMTVLNLIYLTFIWTLVMLFPGFFIQLFNSDTQLLEIGRTCVRIFFLFSFFGALQVSSQSVFVSLGRAKHALFFSLLRKVFLIIPLTLILPYLFQLGVRGVFLAEPLSELIGGSACFITMRRTVWKELGTLEKQKTKWGSKVDSARSVSGTES